MLGGILAAVTQRPFWSAERIKEFVRDGVESRIKALYDSSKAHTTAPLTEFRAMLIFISEGQRTWLVADRLMAYCVQDDRKWEEPKIELWVGLESMLPVKVDERWSGEHGVLYFGDRTKMWSYSKELFLNERPEDAISRFLSSTEVYNRASI